ncbi:DUF3558 domain-containing protein [Nocardia aobensis]|uniref:DUF3558 domain-containing protein n=1 Tax=Nocardia aobensis TaxID=257277 RepID=A0ABW6NWV1_9NOCA
MRTFRAIASLFVMPIILGSCGTNADDSGADSSATTSTSHRPVIAAAVKPAPEQDPAGNKPVIFDPCEQIGDAPISSAGFDPLTRERADQVHTGYAFIGCIFQRRENVQGAPHRVGALTISSTDITLDQFHQRQQDDLTEMTINGKPAISYKGLGNETCHVVMPGPDGSIDLQIESMSAFTNWSACDHAQEIASTVESALPK